MRYKSRNKHNSDMKNRIIVLAAMLCLTLGMMAQSSMTDDQVLSYIQRENTKGTSQQKIVTDLIKKGVNTAQLQRVRRKAEQMKRQAGTDAAGNLTESDNRRHATNVMSVKQNSANTVAVNERGLMQPDQNDSLGLYIDVAERSERKVFGRNIFNKENLTFQPSSNMATPANYTLGAGDAVIVDIWGASQKTINQTISPDGMIVVEGVGPIKLAGLSVSQAKAALKSKLGTRFSGCSFNLSIGDVKTIQVQVVGEVNVPGTYSISGLSTAFNALYAAGGINDIGTLRNIKVYRGGRHIANIDVYEYLINGNSSGDIRLKDNDVIVVGSYDCLVEAKGKVKRPMWYEMKNTETVKQLMRYSGGFTGDAYQKSVRLLRKSGNEYSIHTIEEFDMGAFKLMDEDQVEVDSVRAEFSNMVEVRGAVRHAGKFELGGKIQTVKELLTAADGLREDAYQKNAVMHRLKDDQTLEMLAIDLPGIINGSATDIALKKGDVLFIPSQTEMLGEQTIQVVGEVVYPGTYPYADNTTIRDIILQCGGLKNSASLAQVDVFRRIRDAKATTSQELSAEAFTFSLDENFDLTNDTTFMLAPYDMVIIRKSPSYEEQQNVSISGEVNFEGAYTMTRRDYRLSDLIKASGGLTDKAYIQGAHLTRYMTKTEIEQRDQANKKAQIQLYEDAMKDSKEINMEIADSLLNLKKNLSYTFPVAINLDKAMQNPGSDFDIILRKGDVLEIPEQSNIIKVSGEVMCPVSMPYEKEKNLYWYINHAGGYSQNASRSRVYGIQANGTVVRLHSNSVRDILPGTEIVVPQKQTKKKLSTAEIVGISSTVASMGAVIASLISTLKK